MQIDLNADLEAQRDAVVEARREERERLRHDLHDGLGPSLTGIGLGLQAVDDALAGGDVDQGREIAGVLRAETAATVTEIRRIIDDLRPACRARASPRRCGGPSRASRGRCLSR